MALDFIDQIGRHTSVGQYRDRTRHTDTNNDIMPFVAGNDMTVGLVRSGCTDGTVCVWTVRQPGTLCNTPTMRQPGTTCNTPLTTPSKVCRLY